jgi:adenylylsulfate kinase
MRARKIINEDGLRFIEVFLDCPLAVCESRDPKGFYQKARAGRITDFTGISATYERPDQPELILNTAAQTSDQSAQELVAFIAGLPSQPHWKARSVQ